MAIANLAFKYEHVPELTVPWRHYAKLESAIAYDTSTGVRYGVVTYALLQNSLLVLNIYVEPTARRTGIGTTLIRAIDAKYGNLRTRALVDGVDSETLASVIKLGFDLESRYVGPIDASDIGKYPPPAPRGWFLKYVRNRPKVDYGDLYNPQHVYLHSGFEDDIL